MEIVGAGLAGLTAAITLARRGYWVTIHEGKENIGGDMAYADSTLMSLEMVRSALGSFSDLGSCVALRYPGRDGLRRGFGESGTTFTSIFFPRASYGIHGI